MMMPYGVIGNTPDSGSGILGSSPGRAAGFPPQLLSGKKGVSAAEHDSSGEENLLCPVV